MPEGCRVSPRVPAAQQEGQLVLVPPHAWEMPSPALDPWCAPLLPLRPLLLPSVSPWGAPLGLGGPQGNVTLWSVNLTALRSHGSLCPGCPAQGEGMVNVC